MRDLSRSRRLARVLSPCLLAGACLAPAAFAATPEAPMLELVETAPIETTLDHPDIPNAHEIWMEMIAGAKTSLDFAEFYASDTTTSRLGPLIEAIEAAADRGVQVRFLAERKFHRTYPQILDRLGAHPGIEMRLFDVGPLMGGVLHAKYFLVDGREAYLGSQNFDWRSLTHIVELGVRVREPHVLEAFNGLFAYDWDLAAGGSRQDAEQAAHRVASEEDAPAISSAPMDATAPAGDIFPVPIVYGGDTLRVTPLFSPRDWLPAGDRWDLPELVAMIDSARNTVRVQVLTYRASGRGGGFFANLDSAIRRAAARGVAVELIAADWSKRSGTIEDLQSLQVLPNVTVKLVTIPAWSGGFVPYARVTHAKYLVVDGRDAWVGTGNWERDYFFSSRNVGLRITGRSLAGRLDRFFLDLWDGPYAETVDPCAAYTPPRIGE